MNIINILKYVIKSAGYGVIIAIAFLLLFPDFQKQQEWSWSMFQPKVVQQKPLSYAPAVQAAAPAVVNIYSEDINSNPNYGTTPQRSTRLGSGVIMDASGYILTNFHVIQNADLIIVLLQTGQQLSAELIGYDTYTDLAVLKVDTPNLPVIPQVAHQESYAGDVVLAIGNPLNLGQTVTQGIISATGRSGLSTTSYLEFLQMDAAINEGNSGGALINTNGELVGINSRKFINPNLNIQGIFFAVPYKLAFKVLQKIITHGRVIRGYLGVDANTQNAQVKGFYINNVYPDSPAEKAGLIVGDVVYEINGITIISIAQALDIVAETLPGTELMFKVYRGKSQIDVAVTILEKP